MVTDPCQRKGLATPALTMKSLPRLTTCLPHKKRIARNGEYRTKAHVEKRRHLKTGGYLTMMHKLSTH